MIKITLSILFLAPLISHSVWAQQAETSFCDQANEKDPSALVDERAPLHAQKKNASDGLGQAAQRSRQEMIAAVNLVRQKKQAVCQKKSALKAGEVNSINSLPPQGGGCDGAFKQDGSVHDINADFGKRYRNEIRDKLSEVSKELDSKKGNAKNWIDVAKNNNAKANDTSALENEIETKVFELKKDSKALFGGAGPLLAPWYEEMKNVAQRVDDSQVRSREMSERAICCGDSSGGPSKIDCAKLKSAGGQNTADAAQASSPRPSLNAGTQASKPAVTLTNQLDTSQAFDGPGQCGIGCVQGSDGKYYRRIAR
jgi:hypothetical protein